VDVLQNKYAVSIRSVTEAVDTSSGAVRAAVASLSRILSHERREMTQLRTRGKHQRASEGALATGAVPLGYRLSAEGDLVIDPEAASLIRRIYRMREEKQSLRRIACTLNAENIATRRGGKWHAGTVRYILENPKYKGFITYHFKDERCFVMREGAHAPIIES
jgi:DNA invertase Pin-like site-specific DNA recombinase